MARSKAKSAKEHINLRDKGAGWVAHQKQAKFGDYYAKIGAHAFQVLAAARWVAEAKREAEILDENNNPSGILDPRGLAEYNRRAAYIGKWIADCIMSPAGPDCLRAVAEGLTVAKDLGLTIEEMPWLAVPTAQFTDTFKDENGFRPVRVDELNAKLERQSIPIPLVLEAVPVDPVRLRLAVLVSIYLKCDPARRFKVVELQSWFRDGVIPSDRNLRRIAHEMGIPLVGAGAPKRTKQKRVVR